MARWNHMFDIAFSIESEHENWEDIPMCDLLIALEARVAYLKANPMYVAEAIGFCDDSFEV